MQVSALHQTYRHGRLISDFAVEVDELKLAIGDLVVIQGPNGSGKTTLLHVLSLLRKPSNLDTLQNFKLSVPQKSGGLQTIDVKSLWSSRWRMRQLETLRSRWTGFVPQQLELLPSLRVSETISAPLWLNGNSRSDRLKRVDELLERFGLKQAQVGGNRVGRISGGQQQKTALARAIAHRPCLVFLDEPTAYLFHADAREALLALKQLQDESTAEGHPVTVVMVTHDRKLGEDFATCLVELDVRQKDGRRTGHIAQVTRRASSLRRRTS